MKDLETLSRNAEIPPRASIRGKGKSMSHKLPISKSDFLYIQERHFRGRFTITNCGGFTLTSIRLAEILSSNHLLTLKIDGTKIDTVSPDGSEWRTVKLMSAFKTSDGKFCVIDIEPPTVGKED